MKTTMMTAALLMCGAMSGETVDEAYARLTAYRSVWETNAYAYVKTIPLSTDPAAYEANARWFIDFVGFPDVTETNRLSEILGAKEDGMWRISGAMGIGYNTNAWFAVADYVAHLKAVADPRWIDESYNVVTDVLSDGVAICANTNPLLNFASYKQEHFENYRQQHTNLVSDIEAINSFHREWLDMVRRRQEREYDLERAKTKALQTIRDYFWRFGTKPLSDEAKAACKSNIIERAQLTPDEVSYTFDE